MSTPITKSFITYTFINNGSFVQPTKLDTILKAIINNLKAINDENTVYLVEYL